jgi:hypothetical protein
MASKFTVAVGDKVAYSVQFLRSIGMSHTDMARARGQIVEVTKYSPGFELAKIDWNGAELPERVNVQNLAKVGLNTRFSAC